MPAKLDDILNSHRTRRPVVCGILNVTPDSFSDGGRFLDPAAAALHAREMVAQSADMIDIGAESTRPGSARISAAEQIARLKDVLPAVAALGVVVSVDTTLAAVAQFALDSGAAVINDVSAGREDAAMLPLAARHGCPIILMHMLGEPATMQKAPHYDDVVGEVKSFFSQRTAAAVSVGVKSDRIILDPGIGFGKTIQHNLTLLARTAELAALGCPLMIGVSRKRFIGEITGAADPAERVWGSMAAAVTCYERGATIFRVHDVAPTVAALKIAAAIEGS